MIVINLYMYYNRYQIYYISTISEETCSLFISKKSRSHTDQTFLIYIRLTKFIKFLEKGLLFVSLNYTYTKFKY